MKLADAAVEMRVYTYTVTTITHGECPTCGSPEYLLPKPRRIRSRVPTLATIIRIVAPSKTHSFKGGPIVVLAPDGWNTNRKTGHMSSTLRLRQVHRLTPALEAKFKRERPRD